MKKLDLCRVGPRIEDKVGLDSLLDHPKRTEIHSKIETILVVGGAQGERTLVDGENNEYGLTV
jgi:hypothetical protein